jgi:DNA-binding CsgD family transcriptional regulator
LLAYTFDASDADAIQLSEPLFGGAGHEVWTAMQRSTEGLAPRAVQRTYLGSHPYGSVAQRFVGSARSMFLELATRNYAPNGFGDLMVLHVVDADHRGCLISAPMARSAPASRKEITRWRRVAAHLRAGYRLSLRQSGRSSEPEAILTPDGKLLHASGIATGASERRALRLAVTREEQARMASARDDAERALLLWPELIAGRWTLVERVDSDGRRFLAAHANAPEVQRRSRLTYRERQVVEGILRSESSKVVALDLGITEATVSEHLAQVLSKLNLRSVAELRAVGRVED